MSNPESNQEIERSVAALSEQDRLSNIGPIFDTIHASGMSAEQLKQKELARTINARAAHSELKVLGNSLPVYREVQESFFSVAQDGMYSKVVDAAFDCESTAQASILRSLSLWSRLPNETRSTMARPEVLYPTFLVGAARLTGASVELLLLSPRRVINEDTMYGEKGDIEPKLYAAKMKNKNYEDLENLQQNLLNERAPMSERELSSMLFEDRILWPTPGRYSSTYVRLKRGSGFLDGMRNEAKYAISKFKVKKLTEIDSIGALMKRDLTTYDIQTKMTDLAIAFNALSALSEERSKWLDKNNDSEPKAIEE